MLNTPKLKNDIALPKTHQRNVFKEKYTRKTSDTLGTTEILRDMKKGQCLIYKCKSKEELNYLQRVVSGIAVKYCETQNTYYYKKFTTRILKNGVGLFCIG